MMTMTYFRFAHYGASGACEARWLSHCWIRLCAMSEREVMSPRACNHPGSKHLDSSFLQGCMITANGLCHLAIRIEEVDFRLTL